ncbi:MAG: hypothetical protein P4L87_25195 [Formivibrio sp.]|nr:hypothetical protein [Formivibrio sp.]
MANNDAELRIGGNIDDLKAATDKATAEIKRMSDQMQSSLNSLNGMFQKLHGTFMAFTAVVAGGAAFKDVINASNDWALESLKLSKILGVTTEQASIMKVAMNHVGIEADLVIAASQKMSKQIFSNGEAFKTLGVQVKDSSGQYRSVVDVMGEANQKLLDIKNPIEQNIAGQQVYGKSWGEIRTILKLTADQMDTAKQRAQDLHLVVGAEGAEQAKRYKEQMRDLNLVGKSLEVQFGQQLTPVFVKLGAWMGEEAPAMGNVFKTVLESIAFVAQSVWLAIKDMGDGLGALAAQANAVLHGDIKLAQEIGRLRDEEAAKNEAAYQKLVANFGKPIESRVSKSPEISNGPTYDFGKDKTKADKSRMSEWDAELAAEKVKYQKEHDLREMSKQEEIAYWKSITDNQNTSKQERIAIAKNVSVLELEIMKQNLQQKKALDQDAIDNYEKIAMDNLKGDEQLAQQEYDQGKISKSELISLQQQYEDRRFEIQREAQFARIAAMQGDPNMDPVAYQKLLDQMGEIDRIHEQAKVKLNGDAAKESQQRWQQSLAPIGSAFEKSINGMIQGTLTMRKALGNLFQSILGEFVNMVVQMGVRWAAMELAKTVSTKEGSTLRALLEKMGLIETTSAQTEATGTTIGTKATEAEAVVGANAAEAGSGAAASVASIPFVGWAMAAGVFATTMAMVLGAKGSIKSASGGFDIPAGVNPVTQLHQEEMVLPAQYANVIRGMAGDGGSGGGDVHMHVHTQSTKDFETFLTQNSHVLAPAIRRLGRNFSPTKA